MGRCRRKRDIDSPPWVEAFHKKNLILTHCMLTAWWLNILDGLGNYIILPGEMEQLLVMTIYLATLGYANAACRLNNPSYILGIIQILTHPTYLRGSHRMPRHPMALSGTNTKESPITFYTSTGYTIWDSGWTHSIKPYFDLYTEYHHLEEGYITRVNGI